MATSDSIDFAVSRDDIITEALELVGVLGEGQTPNSDQLTSCARTLNMMLKNWQTELNLFAIQRVYLFPQTSTSEYTLSSSTTHHYSTEVVSTTTSAAASSGASTITVSDASSISDGDYIGVYLSTGVFQWTTVNGAPAGSTVTLSATLTQDVAASATVYSYTSKATRPMRVIEAYTINTSGYRDSIDVIARRDFFNLSNTVSTGEINQVYYDPQVSAGTLYVWPNTDDERTYLLLFIQRTLDDLDVAADNVDFPQEWYLPIAYNLALLLTPKYGVPSSVKRDIQDLADKFYQKASEWDTEMYTSVYFGVKDRR